MTWLGVVINSLRRTPVQFCTVISFIVGGSRQASLIRTIVLGMQSENASKVSLPMGTTTIVDTISPCYLAAELVCHFTVDNRCQNVHQV